MRRAVVYGLGTMQLADPRPVADVLVPLLDDPVRALRISAMTLLGKFHDPRAVPTIAALLKSKKPPRDNEHSDIIRALGSIADDASVALLNAMSLTDQRVQEEVLRIAQALNVSYQRINNRGTIFGHREVKIREGDNDVFRTFAFLGDHIFSDVPVFDVNAMTDGGQLLCFRSSSEKPQSFVWDGAAF